MILWYQQLKGDGALNLIGYVNYKNSVTESQCSVLMEMVQNPLLLTLH